MSQEGRNQGKLDRQNYCRQAEHVKLSSDRLSPDLKERSFDSSRFCAKETLLSAKRPYPTARCPQRYTRSTQPALLNVNERERSGEEVTACFCQGPVSEIYMYAKTSRRINRLVSQRRNAVVPLELEPARSRTECGWVTNRVALIPVHRSDL